MDILSQFLVPSSLNRPRLMLAAPLIRLALPAPRPTYQSAGAGLLTAGAAPQSVCNLRLPGSSAASQDYLVFDRLPTWEEMQAQLSCPSIEEMDAEIMALIADHREARRRVYAARSVRPAVREV